MRLSFAAIALLLVALGGAHCWHDPGHYTVAYIAQEYLAKVNPDALKWANDILDPFTYLCGENLYPFVECANWPDKIKEQGWHLIDQHHFISNPFFDEGAPVNPYFEKSTNANAVFSINQNINTLTSTKEDPYGSSKSLLGKSLSMRTLVHMIGDIHQPLHAEERVTPKHPEGDMGGNKFKIKHYNDRQMDNLHFVWDEMFRPFSTSFRTNLSPERYRQISEFGDGIMKQHPFSSLQAAIRANTTAVSWGLESFNHAKNFAYKGIVEGQDLPEDYMKKGLELCRERVALGGYRLGMTIDKIYSARNSAALGSSPDSLVEASQKRKRPVSNKMDIFKRTRSS